jgi:deoxyribonuclease V
LIVCVDVDYRADAVVAAAIAIPTWDTAAPAVLRVVRTPGAAPAYESGSFWKRELPYSLAALAAVEAAGVALDVVVVDGYVWLGPGAPGLGARLRAALAGNPAVVGVAKTPFRTAASVAREVLRGASTTPLFVTSDGIEPARAAAHVKAMHGAHRVPTILRAVDRACRDG